jgi:hypothetical protein
MKSVPISEAHIQQTVREFLELDGWRAIRTDPVSDRSRGKGFGEIGMADYLFIRYRGQMGAAEAMWIEFKRKGEQPKPHQKAWLHAERLRGAIVMVVDDIDIFAAWYKTSGLCRPIIR